MPFTEITTEQEVLNTFYPNNNTKTMSDVITEFERICTTNSLAISTIKELFPNVSDWSI